MEVKVFWYGFLRELTGEKELTVSIEEAATLQNLIERLGEKFGEEVRGKLEPDCQSSYPLLIMVGGKDYRFAGGLQMKLEDKTSVYFIPPAAGG